MLSLARISKVINSLIKYPDVRFRIYTKAEVLSNNSLQNTMKAAMLAFTSQSAREIYD